MKARVNIKKSVSTYFHLGLIYFYLMERIFLEMNLFVRWSPDVVDFFASIDEDAI